jgi:non-ribosomal peptide synthetase component F
VATESRTARPDRADRLHGVTLPGAEGAPERISVALEALWMTSLLHPRAIPYNEAISIRKQGALNPDALRQAFNQLVRRYDTWHGVFPRLDGEPVLQGQMPTRFALAVTDLSPLDGEAAEREAVRIVSELARMPYDLTHGPLLRPRLLRFPAQEHRLYLAMHHSIFDGVSLTRTVLPELIALYDRFCEVGEAPPEAPRAGYKDFARWEREWISTPRAARRMDHWRRRLTPAPPQLSLPTDEPRPPSAGFRGATVPAVLSPQVAAALRATARSCGTTEFQALGAAWAALLSRVTGETDVVFGTPTDLRRRRQFEPVIGYCLSPLVLRVDLSDDPTFGNLMLRIRNELLDGLDHVVPFERIVRDLEVTETDGGNPLYRAMFVLEPAMAAHDPQWSLHQIDTALADAVGVAKLDLELQLDPRPDGSFAGQLIYDRDLFTRETAQRFIDAWRALVEALAADPERRVSDPDLRDGPDEGRVREFNATATDWVARPVAQRFAEVAASAADARAVTAGGLSVSYGELQRLASAGARRLQDAGVVAPDAVAVCLEPSIPLVSAALAVLNLGAAVLLLDPAEPADVLAARAERAGCTAVMVAELDRSDFDQSALTTVPWTVADGTGPVLAHAAGPADDPDRPSMLVGPLDPSERPSCLSHATVDTLVSALIADLGLGPGDVVLTLPEMLYESPWTELWPALLAGGRLVIAPAHMARDGAQLSRLIRAEGVTFLHATPSRWEALIDSGLRAARGLTALSGGEPLTPALAARLGERCRVVWSAYGPVAPGVYCTLGRVRDSGPLSIGRPLAGHRAHVVDARGRPVPVGFVGELLLTGPLALADAPGSDTLAHEPGGAAPARRTGRRGRWLRDGRLALTPLDGPPEGGQLG